MKSVLISIQPYWVFLIVAKAMGWNISQQKTVEVRKNYPKAENWNKVVKIYCSKDKKSFSRIPKEYQPLMEQFSGKVIGEFVCKRCEVVPISSAPIRVLSVLSLVPVPELYNYTNGKSLYGWKISDLVIYDEPKELGEFIRICPEWEKEEITDKCRECEHHFRSYEECYEGCVCEGELPVTRPPQSWCYVEELKDDG